MSWRIKITEHAKKTLDKMDQNQRAVIMRWIGKNLDGCEDPRGRGAALAGKWSGYWRYRVGNYRIICELDDGRMVVVAIKIGHRRVVYRR